MADMIIERLSGCGLYIRALQQSKQGTPKQAAKRAADHGISFVAIMSIWQDIRKGKFRHLRGNLLRDKFLRYFEAFHAKDIKVGTWFYPWGGHEDRLLDDLARLCEEVELDFLLDDGELGHKWTTKRRRRRRRVGGVNDTGTMRGGQREAFDGVPAQGTRAERIAQVTKLWDGLEELVRIHNIRCGAGATAYGIAGYHPTFPWRTKLERAEFLSPQLYTATPKQVDLGIRQWYGFAGEADVPFDARKDLIASIGTFGKNSEAKLDHFLGSFVDGEESLDGFIAWSWRQTSRLEWRVLARWAERIERGAFELPCAA